MALRTVTSRSQSQTSSLDLFPDTYTVMSNVQRRAESAGIEWRGRSGDPYMIVSIRNLLWLGASLIWFYPSSSMAQCVDYSKDPAGCQPSTFDTPIGQMPSVRVGKEGNLDPFSSETDARAGAAKLEKDLHLYRNFELLHWVLTVPSQK